MRVLLLLMPWANPSFPNLAIGLLKAVLDREGIPADTLHANVLAADALGDPELYDAFSTDLASELVFAPLYRGGSRQDAADALAERLSPAELGPDGDSHRFLHTINWAERLIETLTTEVPWQHYDVAGFSLSFQQTMASLALAKRVKAEHPHVHILFGGASCDGDMGPAMLRSFPEVDYVFVGEADSHIAAVIREIRSRESSSQPVSTPGLATRVDGDKISHNGTAPFTRDLDSLPLPSFDEYFQLLERLANPWIRPRLFIEHSRGCWYGEHRACSFCGLSEMTYRRKSAAVAREEILALARTYRMSDFYMSDNILDFRYFKDLLPELARLRHDDGYDLTLFYELKSNLRESHVQMLAAAGVAMVQIGIESFDDHVLSLMQKGSTAIMQVQALKHLYEQRIHPVWNILHDNPGERPEDYDRMAELFEAIDCLPPPAPGHIGPMVLQRFSRYWRDPSAFGLREVRPDPVYREMFPSPTVDVAELACFFQYDHDQQNDHALDAARKRALSAVDRWRERFRPYSLTYERGPAFVRIVDRRDGGQRVSVLTGLEQNIFEICRWARGRRTVHKQVNGRASPEAVDDVLKDLVDRRFLLHASADSFLSLPVRNRLGALA